MRIGIDATPLSLSSGGLRRYTEELSRALATTFPDDEIWLLSDQPFQHPAPKLPNLLAGSTPQRWIYRRWWLMGLAREIRRLEIELFHGTNFAVPFLDSIPAVMSIHDLSPWMDPAWHSSAGRVRATAPRVAGLGLASMVLTDSEAVRRQVISRFGLHPSRTRAVPLAAWNDAPQHAAVAQRPYFLFTGTLEPRKNVHALLKAWRPLRGTHGVDLVLAGRRREDFAALANEPGLELRGEVPDAELPGLYANAIALVYPSFYEGFGLPVLEAMSCGAAVITSFDPSIAEVTGGAGLQAPAEDPEALSDAMRRLLLDPGLRLRCQTESLERAKLFSWSRTARETRAVYEEAIERF